MKKYILLFSSVIVIKFFNALILKEYRRKNRVILLFASGPEQPRWLKQLNIMTAKTEEATHSVYTEFLPDKVSFLT